MRRIAVLVLSLLFFVAPLVANAQPARRAPRIGYLSPASLGRSAEAFRHGMRELGYVEVQNIVIEWRFAEGQHDRLPVLAAELVRANVEIIVTDGDLATRAVRDATKSIPIVLAASADPIGTRDVASLARPGGNVTGLTNLQAGLSAKRVELLKEAMPGLARVGAIWNPGNPQAATSFKEAQTAGQALGVRVQSLEVRKALDFEPLFRVATRDQAEALTVLSDALMFAHRTRLVDVASKHKLPTIHTQSGWVDAGALMSYGPSLPDLARRAATYVDKILKGTKPGDLPIEQPTKFELVINSASRES